MLLTLMVKTDFMPDAGASSPTPTVFFDGEVEAGWAWIKATCPENSDCGNMTILAVSESGATWNATNRFSVEWIAEVDAGRLTVTLIQEGAIIQSAFLSGSSHESGDAPDGPPSGTPTVNESFSAIGCSGLTECANATFESDSSPWNGVLSSGSDVDVLPLVSSPGDVYEIQVTTNRHPIVIEAWTRSGQQPMQLLSHEVTNATDRGRTAMFSAGMDPVWLKVRSDGIDEVIPYEFRLSRHLALNESPMGELPASGVNQDPRDPSWIAGHLSRFDAGDSVLLAVSPGLEAIIDCESTSTLLLDVIDRRTSESIHATNSSACPFTIQVPERADAIEVRFEAHGVDAGWRLNHSIQGNGDGEGRGDAPSIWWNVSLDHPSERDDWIWFSSSSEGVAGWISESGDIDVWMIDLSKDSWVEATLADESAACCSIGIIVLNQTDGTYIGFHDEGANLSAGSHAITIVANPNTSADYSFDLRIVPIVYPEAEEFQDLSGLFTNFYILIGILLLSPLALVLYWRITGRDGEASVHEQRRRLRRLRERLSTKVENLGRTADESIESALRQLGDAEWDALTEEWGDPVTRHSTDSIEIVAWTLSDSGDTLIVGIRNRGKTWTHAALRCASGEGEAVSIIGVHPRHLHFEDEIDLGNLDRGDRLFLRISIEAGTRAIDLHLSGIVAGDPMAATTPRAIVFEEE